MSRTDPWALKIRDLVADRLEKIGVDPSIEWFSSQAKVFRGISKPQMLGANVRPTLGVRCTEIAQGDQGPNYITDDRKGEILVVGIVTDPVDREAVAYRLESDILAVIGPDKRLGGQLAEGRIIWKSTKFFEGQDDQTGGIDMSFEFEVFSDNTQP